MICKQCKKEIPDDSNVCEFCGIRLRDYNGNLIEDQPKVESTYNSDNQQNNYNVHNNAPLENSSKGFNEDEHVSMWQWLGIMAINLIPCVGPLIYIVMMFVWGFGSTQKHSLKTYARASLIMALIVLALYILIVVIAIAISGGVATVISEYGSYY